MPSGLAQNIKELFPSSFLRSFQHQFQPLSALEINAAIRVSSHIFKWDSIQRQLDIFKWRSQTDYPIAKIVHVRLLTSAPEKFETDLEISIENFKLTLSDLRIIQLPYVLYIFRSVLRGAAKISSKFGYFYLSSKMIGITFMDECKIWVNEDWSKNHVTLSCSSERVMIMNIISILLQKCQITNASRKFFTSSLKQCTTFSRSQEFLTKFSFQNQLLIPPYFQKQEQIKETIKFHRRTKSSQYRKTKTEGEQFQLRNPSRRKSKKKTKVQFCFGKKSLFYTTTQESETGIVENKRGSLDLQKVNSMKMMVRNRLQSSHSVGLMGFCRNQSKNVENDAEANYPANFSKSNRMSSDVKDSIIQNLDEQIEDNF